MSKMFVVLFLVLTSTAVALADDSTPPSLSCGNASKIVQLSLRGHLLHHEMTAELADRAAKMYVGWIENAGDILDQAEVDSLDQSLGAADRTMLSIEMLTGDCSFFVGESQVLADAYKELMATFTTAEALRDEILAQPTTPLPDTKKPAASAFEVRARALNALAVSAASWNKDADQKTAALFVARYYLATMKLRGDAISSSPYEQMVEAFTLSLDPHSMYHPPAESSDFLGRLTASSFSGIGAIMGRAMPYGLPIEAVVPGGPASLSGQVTKGEIIVKVDGNEVSGLLSTDVVKMIKGPTGTSVTLTLGTVRDGQLADMHDVTIVRAPISNTAISVSSQAVDIRGKHVLVVTLKEFFDGAGAGVAKMITDEQAKGRVDAVVLDLRDDGGGLVTEAVNVTNDFVKAGPVLAAVDSKGNKEVYRVEHPEAMVYDGPLLVAISKGSASASEIVTGTLKDLGRALVVGDVHTYGKGSMQTVLNLRSYGAMALTIAQFYTAGGASTQLVGVSSDVVVQGPADVTDDEMEMKAKYPLPASKIAPLMTASEMWHTAKPWASTVARLKALSAARLVGTVADKRKASEQLTELENIAADYATIESSRH